MDTTGGTKSGSAHIFQGNASTFSTNLDYEQADFSVYGDDSTDRLGLVQVGDLDANGLSDIVISSAADGGEAFLFYGPIRGDACVSDATAHVEGIGNTHCFQYVTLADIDQDGSSDLMATCPETVESGLHILLGVSM